MSMLGLLAAFLPALAELCEEGQCTMPPDQPTTEVRGISLMQSGRSVMPAIGLNGPKFVNDGLVDDFAAMEDEFDDGSVQPHTATDMLQKTTSKGSLHSAPVLKLAGDPYLYVETLLVIAIFTLAAKGFKWAFSSSPKATLKSTDVGSQCAPKPEPLATAKVEEQAPILVLGGSKDFPALEQAVRAGDEARCLELLKQGGRMAVRQEDPCGCTALHVAAHCGSVTMARLLLNHGAKVDAREAWEETPLHIAARSGNGEVCDLLLDNGADIDAADASGRTPLLLAGDAKHEAVCELLLSHGAGAGGIADTEVPPLVNALLFRRMFAGAVPRPPVEVHSDVSDPNEEVSRTDSEMLADLSE